VATAEGLHPIMAKHGKKPQGFGAGKDKKGFLIGTVE